MNDQMALRLIAEIMNWPMVDGTATDEYRWLRQMSAVKYDGYSDFRAGVRFLESLATWLKQFDQKDRAAAYAFIKRRLVYISPAELQCRVDSFIPEVVTAALRTEVADAIGAGFVVERLAAQAWGNLGSERYNAALSAVIDLHNAARIDIVRRKNILLKRVWRLVKRRFGEGRNRFKHIPGAIDARQVHGFVEWAVLQSIAKIKIGRSRKSRDQTLPTACNDHCPTK